MSQKKTVIIFDWDDTLLDAGHILRTSQRQAIASILQDKALYPFTKNWSVPDTSKFIEHTGHRFKEKVVLEVMPELDTAIAEHCEWRDDVFNRFINFYRETEKKLFPDVKEMLISLKNAGYPLCIATNKSYDLLIDEMKKTGVKTLFSHVITGDSPIISAKTKPNPDMINYIQSKFPDHTLFVMVGDREFDITAAQTSNHANNTKTIGITKTSDNPLKNANIRLKCCSKITEQIIEDIHK